MVIDAYFDNVIIYNVAFQMDVLTGEKFTLVMDNPAEMNDVFANNDKVLSHDHHETDIDVEALAVGKSTIRIMKDSAIVRDILINVVSSIQRPAVALGSSLSSPVPK